MIKQLILTAILLGGMNLFGAYASDLGGQAKPITTNRAATEDEKVVLGQWWKEIRSYFKDQNKQGYHWADYCRIKNGIIKIDIEIPYTNSGQNPGVRVSLYQQLEEEIRLNIATQAPDKSAKEIQECELSRLYKVKELFDRRLNRLIPSSNGRLPRSERVAWGFNSQFLLVSGLGLVAIMALAVNFQRNRVKK